ncbi:MAG: DUF3987 domain-containing protein [Armatimonadota bacterium]
MNVHDILSRLENVRGRGPAAWQARCPAHDDKQASLSIGIGKEDRTVLKCFANCATESIVAAMGLTMKDLFPDDGSQRYQDLGGVTQAGRGGLGRLVKTYPYTQADGSLVFEVLRYEPKTFRQRRPDGRGGYIHNLQGVQRVLYHLPDVLKAVGEGQRVYLSEGEKDVDNLRKIGLCATTNAQGAGKWTSDYTDSLRGAHVVLLPHNDKPGQEHAELIAAALSGSAASVRIVSLPSLPPKGDVSDWLTGGGTAAVLEKMADDAAEWKPGAASLREPGVSPVFDTAPSSLSMELLPVPCLNMDIVPAPLRGWLADIAARGCFPVEYPAAAALVSLSAAVGRRIGIRPKRYDDWTVIPNLWGAIIGPPGVQKTPATAEALKPLHRLEVESRKAFEEEVKDHEAGQLVVKAKQDAAKDALRKKAKSGGTTEDLRDLALQAAGGAADEKPVWRRFIVNDTTVEKLGELLGENPDGLLMFRDELTGFLRTLERQGHESDRAFYLEAWNGSGSFTYDRIGRGTTVIDAACLSLFGTIQPGPLARYLRGAASGDEADGFAPRLQILVYPDPPKTFRNVDRWPSVEARAAAFGVFQRLADLVPHQVGAEFEEGEPLPYLRFDTEAQERFDTWRETLENRLRSGSDTPLMQMHLAKYRSLLPSLALLLHLSECEAGGPVPLLAIERAIAWCVFLEAHARRVYQSAMDGDAESAHRLAERIKQSLPNPFTTRLIVKKGWSGLTTTEEVDRAVGLLEDRGWVKTQETTPGEAGGRPSVQIYINPAVLCEITESATQANQDDENIDIPNMTYRQNRQNPVFGGFAGSGSEEPIDFSGRGDLPGQGSDAQINNSQYLNSGTGKTGKTSPDFSMSEDDDAPEDI